MALDTEKMMELARAAREGLPELAESSIWCEELRQGGVDSISALLLLWCKRLTDLVLVIDTFSPEENEDFFVLRFVTLLVNKLVVQAPQKPLRFHPLAELRSVVLRSLDTHCEVPAQYAAPFFHLPKLEVLAGVRLDNLSPRQPLRSVRDDPHDPDASDAGSFLDSDKTAESRLHCSRYLSLFPVGTSTIEELILQDLNITFAGLFTLVRACRSLKKLVLTTDCYSRTLSQSDRNSLVRSILHHASSLEELVLRLYEHDVWEDEVPSNGSTNLEGCFKSLYSLKRLTIDINVLYPIENGTKGEMIVDRLPSSLEHLCLECQPCIPQHALPNYIVDIPMFMEGCGSHGYLSKLESLELSWDQIEDHPVLWSLGQLRMIAAEKGVRLRFRGDNRNLYPDFVPEPEPPLPGC
ncbi:hypothetical protein NW762_011389 [Fusarium torreyae]|uniref:F-box domain-containing protein n=1 Tax=Fusarium torreyae TaxID=1237075 RepID=A0A9W8VCA5_9HYPO|nr:hypothetical protein NW762_011389 [Fusarium torreyae]